MRRLLAVLVRTHGVPEDPILVLRGRRSPGPREATCLSRSHRRPYAGRAVLGLGGYPTVCLCGLSGLVVVHQRGKNRVCLSRATLSVRLRVVKADHSVRNETSREGHGHEAALFARKWTLTRTPRAIRLGEHRAFGGESGALSTLASVPVFLFGVVQSGWAWVERKVPFVESLFARRLPYRQVPIDDDGKSRSPAFKTFV